MHRGDLPIIQMQVDHTHIYDRQYFLDMDHEHIDPVVADVSCTLADDAYAAIVQDIITKEIAQ